LQVGSPIEGKIPPSITKMDNVFHTSADHFEAYLTGVRKKKLTRSSLFFKRIQLWKNGLRLAIISLESFREFRRNSIIIMKIIGFQWMVHGLMPFNSCWAIQLTWSRAIFFSTKIV